jgi:hypothetical protein
MSATTKENTEKLLTASRASYIEGFLAKDPLFKAAVKGNKEVPLKGRNGTTVNFNPHVVEVVKAVIESGADPYDARKADVLKMAKKVIKVDAAADGNGNGNGEDKAPGKQPKEVSSAAAAPESDWNPQGVPGVTPIVAVVSLGLSMLQQADFDKSEGAVERRKELDTVVAKYIALLRVKPGAKKQ